MTYTGPIIIFVNSVQAILCFCFDGRIHVAENKLSSNEIMIVTCKPINPGTVASGVAVGKGGIDGAHRKRTYACIQAGIVLRTGMHYYVQSLRTVMLISEGGKIYFFGKQQCVYRTAQRSQNKIRDA